MSLSSDHFVSPTGKPRHVRPRHAHADFIWAAGAILAISLTWPTHSLGRAAEAPPSLRDVLTPEEFRRAGLEKLAPEELDFLSRRLLGSRTDSTPVVPPAARRETPLSAPTPAPAVEPEPPVPAATAGSSPKAPQGAAAFGREAQLRESVEAANRIPNVLESRILGTFRGWDGHTLFRLENGQVWQQAEDGQFAVRRENPKVRIEKGAFGTYYLSVEGYGTRVKVRRVS